MKKFFDLLNIKRVVSLIVALCLVIGLMPMTAFAYPGDGGHVVDEVMTDEFPGCWHGTIYSYEAQIVIYATPGACEIKKTSGDGDEMGRSYTVKYNSDKWVFKGWKTWYIGGLFGIGDSVNKENPRHDISDIPYFAASENRMSIIKEASYGGVYYMYAIFEPIVKVNAGEGVSYTLSGGTSTGEDEYSVLYQSPISVTYEADSDYVVTNTTVNGAMATVTDGSITIDSVRGPVSVSINTKKKQCDHSDYTYFGNGNVITETCTDQCGHSATATIERNTSVPTIYTGSAIEALKVMYSDDWKGGSLDISYTDNINAGTAQGAIAKSGATAKATFDIQLKNVADVITPNVEAITYGQKLSNAVLEDEAWEWEDESILPTVNNNGYIAYYTPADTSNYDWSTVSGWDADLQKVVRTVPVPVTPRELTITWGNTNFVYDGTGHFPSFTVDGIIAGDDISFIRSGFEINANANGETYTATITGIGGEDAANYTLPNNASVEFTIAGIYSVIFDLNGGNIFGFTDPIEVPLNVNGTLTDNVPWPTKEGHTFLGYYTEDDELIENPGNYIFTQNTRLIARYAINEYTVTVPEKQVGYRLETDVTKIEHGGEVYISIAIKEGYEKTDAFAVKVNGEEVELTEYNNVVVTATEDMVITVEGVEPTEQSSAGGTSDKTAEPNDKTAGPSDSDKGAETGDGFNVALWAMIMILSLTIGTSVVLRRKKDTAE